MNPVEQPATTNTIPNTSPKIENTHPKQKNGGMKVFVTIIMLLLLGGLAFVSYQLFLKDTQVQSLQQEQQKVIEANRITIPRDAVQVSGCLPYMGVHWVRPQDVPHGPYYVTYNGKLTALEYMYREDEIPGAAIATASASTFGQYMQTHTLGDLTKPEFTFDLSGVNNIKFTSIEWTAPHAGFIVPHYDVHYYLVSKEETQSICPNAKLEEAQTPAIEEILRKNNIPYIPVEGPAPTNPSTVPTVPATTSAQSVPAK